MKPNYFPTVLSWQIPRSVLSYSLAEIKKDGLHGNEGIVLWLGHRHNGQAKVTHLVALRGEGITRGPASLRIESKLLNDVTDVAIDLGVVLVGQIHSHGPGFGTALSYSDRTLGFAFPDYLSIVAPDYALNKSTPLNKCGIFVFERSFGFRCLSAIEIKQRIKLVAGSKPPTLTIGEEYENK